MKKILIGKVVVLFLAVSVLAPAAMAQRNTAELEADGWVLWDFPSIPSTTQPDTVSGVLDYPWNAASDTPLTDGDPADLQQALYIGEQARAWYRFADTPTFGTLSFYVYDKGTAAVHASSTYGPRWGVQNNPEPNPIPATGTPNDELMSAELTMKAFIDTGLTYSFINATSDGSSPSSHFSPSWPGTYEGSANGDHGYRRVAGATLATPIIPADVQVYDQANNVQGAWAMWSFTVHDGEDMVFMVTDADGVSNPQDWTVIPTLDSIFDTGFSTTGFNQVHFYGGNVNGNGNEDTVGLWVDNIVFTPDDGQGVDPWSENFNATNGGPHPCEDNWAMADFNCDGEVGLLDLDILGQVWGDICPLINTWEECFALNDPWADANADNEVGLLDLDALGIFWGTTGIPIPEPATLGLLAIASVMFIRRR